MDKTILILGAGTGGIATAHELAKKTGDNAKILLFEKEEQLVFAPSLLWLMVGKRKPRQVFRSVNALARKNIEIIRGKIDKINPHDISVMVDNRTYKGNYMVVSLGVQQNTEHDLDRFGHDFYTLDGATRFHEQLRTFRGGKIAILVPSLPFKCPAAPYEAAMLTRDFVRKKGLSANTVISLYTPEPGPMGVAGKELSGAVRQLVEGKGIHYHPEHQLVSATEKSLLFLTAEGEDKTVSYDLLTYTPKHQCPAVVTESGLTGESGWVEVDRHSLETAFDNVYAIGDITHIPLEMGIPLPKAGVFAHYQAEVVAHNIAQRIAGKSPAKTFNGNGQCFLEMGGGMAGYAGGDFYASPTPAVKMKKPGYLWHWSKVWFEKYWFFKYF